MRMDEHARAWMHDLVTQLLNAGALAPEQRSSLHWEIVSHLHEAAERRVTGRGGQYITLLDLQHVVQDLGGRDGISASFLQTRVAATGRAAFSARFFAYVLDLVVVALGVGLVFATIGWVVWFLAPLAPLAAAAMAYAYFVALEVRFGATLGKMVLNLRTVMEDGRPITLHAALIRNVSKVFAFPLIFLDALLYAFLFRQQKQRASDRIAKTIVIDSTKPAWAPAPVPPYAAPPAPMPGPMPGTLSQRLERRPDEDPPPVQPKL